MSYQSRKYTDKELEYENTEGGTEDDIQYKVLKPILKSTDTALGSCRHRVKNA